MSFGRGPVAPQPGRREQAAAGYQGLYVHPRRIVVVDAARSGAAPGTVRRFDARSQPLPVRSLRSSTHAFGVADAIELARSLGRLPERVEVYAIEGASFVAGDSLSPSVERAVAALADELGASGR